jgi:hypothetical protein
MPLTIRTVLKLQKSLLIIFCLFVCFPVWLKSKWFVFIAGTAKMPQNVDDDGEAGDWKFRYHKNSFCRRDPHDTKKCEARQGFMTLQPVCGMAFHNALIDSSKFNVTKCSYKLYKMPLLTV